MIREYAHAALDLDSVFGGGPGMLGSVRRKPDGSVGPKLKIGTGGVHEDGLGSRMAMGPTPLCWGIP